MAAIVVVDALRPCFHRAQHLPDDRLWDRQGSAAQTGAVLHGRLVLDSLLVHSVADLRPQ